jgi:hypothetical protein
VNEGRGVARPARERLRKRERRERRRIADQAELLQMKRKGPKTSLLLKGLVLGPHVERLKKSSPRGNPENDLSTNSKSELTSSLSEFLAVGFLLIGFYIKSIGS